MQEATTRFALAVMLVYVTLAFAHILYLGISGISSSAWDSTTEIVALAMNSTPTKYLQNTCAGILGIRTFQTRVRILATNNNLGQDEHLELVFGEDSEWNTLMTRLALNKEYGALHID